MHAPTWRLLLLGLCIAPLAFIALAIISAGAQAADAPSAGARVFEMRTYTTHPGRLDALNARFRDHTCRLFEKHGMELIGFWTPTEGPEAENTLVYILAFPSREAREAAFQAFRADPEWQKARDASEADGPIVQKVVSQFLAPTDYSKTK